jgi:thioredoxin-related protein
MKYLITFFLLTTALFSANLDWPSDYEKALTMAKKENKLVYVLITSDSCRWCRKFENTTLKNKQILDRLHKGYVLVHLSRDRHIVPKKFKTAPIPRHYFLDENGEILYSSLGHRNEDMFNAFMDNAEEKHNINKEKK